MDDIGVQSLPGQEEPPAPAFGEPSNLPVPPAPQQLR